MSTTPRIKFCGLTRAADVDAALALGIDLLGLVLVERSARNLSLDAARMLRRRVPAGVAVVALVMDAGAARVRAICDTLSPDYLQFHGRETDRFCAGFGVPFFKAVGLGGVTEEQLPARLGAWPSAHALVLDGHAAGAMGGSGESFDWQLLRQPPRGQRILLAGGLHAGNVGEAVRIARPWGVDVSSGIESAPGIKDAARMRAFVAAVRAGGA